MRQQVAVGGLVIASLGLVVAGCSGSRAPFAPYKGPYPAPGAITAFDSTVWYKRDETKAGAPPFLKPNSIKPNEYKLGTLDVASGSDSVVILLYGDNRPGFRMMTTSWGVPAVINGFASPSFRSFFWGMVNLPVALVQGFIPKMDLPRDLYSAFYSHKFSGGAEKRVLDALTKEIARDPQISFVVQTGDVVENGRRGGQWEDYAKRHAALRQKIPYLASVGNHERTWNAEAQQNWNAVMGPPAQPGRNWFAVDFPDSIARFCFLDSNILADPKDHYPDSLETAMSNEQLAWLDSALAVPARFRFVVLHHPVVTSGHYLSDWQYDDSKPAETRRRGRLISICHRRNVTAILAGHEHLYQRTFVQKYANRGFWHITTGGGGSPLYRLSEEERKGALSLTLPDSSKVTWNAATSVYHYSRLTIVRRPKPGEDHIRLDVYSVGKKGQITRIDHQDLADFPKEKSN
jgi:3',5'-cyclic AMP phosphodiesterase CpdA